MVTALVKAKAMFIKLIMIIGVAYIFTLGGLYFGQRKLVFPAAAYYGTPADAGVPAYQEIHVTTIDGLNLRAWYLPARDPALPVVVHFHGNGSYLGGRVFAAEGQAAAGYGVLITSYRGYSGNPGSPTEDGLYMDARAQLDWLKGQGVSNIVLQGESLGTGVAIQMAAERQVAAVVLESPYTSLPDAAAKIYPYFPVHLLMKDRFASIEKIGQVHAPLLILMGERDTVIPIEQGRALFAAANDPKAGIWLPEATHFDLYRYGAGPAIMEFLNTRFRPAATPE